MSAKDYMAVAKKQNSTILKARLKSNKFEVPEEKEAYLAVLTLRGVDVSNFTSEAEAEEKLPLKVVQEGPEESPEVVLTGVELDNAADEAYEAICEENNQEKVKALAALLIKEDGTSKDWEEMTEEDKLGTIRISKMEVKKVVPPVAKDKSVVKKEVEVDVVFTEEQLKIADKSELTKAERVRQLYDSGLTVKQIAKNTGWDYVNAYDTIKAYLKKKEKMAEGQA